MKWPTKKTLATVTRCWRHRVRRELKYDGTETGRWTLGNRDLYDGTREEQAVMKWRVIAAWSAGVMIDRCCSAGCDDWLVLLVTCDCSLVSGRWLWWLTGAAVQAVMIDRCYLWCVIVAWSAGAGDVAQFDVKTSWWLVQRLAAYTWWTGPAGQHWSVCPFICLFYLLCTGSRTVMHLTHLFIPALYESFTYFLLPYLLPCIFPFLGQWSLEVYNLVVIIWL